ncbi:MAG: GIY-YIG nuclease family protein [Cytophagales bacterium]|nr:GIY-YIG nuclease family protein [Cytophagales bacterium]
MQYNVSDFESRIVPAKFYQTGIYKIECIDGRCYIGSTTQSFRKRWLKHISQLSKNKHHSKYLQNIYNKHGIEFFSFSILEVVEDKAEIIGKEQYWIDNLNPELNMLKLAGSCIGYKHSYETRKKFSNAKRVGKSGTGISYIKQKSSYKAAICSLGYKISLGYYRSYEEALEARLKGESLFWSEEFESKSNEDKENIINEFRAEYKAMVANRSKDEYTFKNKATREQKKGSPLCIQKLKNGYKVLINVDGVDINLGRYLEEHEAINVKKEAQEFYYSTELRAKPKEERIAFIKQTIKDKLFYSKSTLKTKTGEKYIRHLKNDTFLFSHEKSRHYKTLKTLDQAISYRDKYLDNIKTSTQQDKTSL